MAYEIEPYIGVGPIRLGMTREEIHALGFEEPELRAHRGSEKPGDCFPTLGFYVDYRAPGVCEFVEFAGPLSPTFHQQTGEEGKPCMLARATLVMEAGPYFLLTRGHVGGSPKLPKYSA